MTAYYNDNDRHAVVWLKNLIDAGLIAPGTVDGRSIADVRASDLLGHDRVHLFAGIGGWEYALALAGWPADAPVWTGSCPCQPFSQAGRRRGEDDARHLWPEMLRLIAGCRPPVVLGEQVGGTLGYRWIAGVYADLEAIGYRVPRDEHGDYEAYDLPAAGVGAPHIRQRLWWVVDAAGGRSDISSRPGHEDQGRLAGGPGATVGLGDPEGGGCRVVGDAPQPGSGGHAELPGWSGFDLVHCRDGKARRVEPGTFPLVARLPEGVVRGGDPGAPIDPCASSEARVMRLRGYGNSIAPALAAEFIKAYLEARRP